MAHILVVDDEIAVREWLIEILQGAGHQVIAANDGLEALILVKQETFDVIITDISMPNQDGFGLINEVRKAHPTVKIIVLTGKDDYLLREALLLGAHAALKKPVTAHAIRRSIDEVLGVREKPMSRRTEGLPLEHGRLKSEYLHGPFVLTDEMIDVEVAPQRPGAFILGADDSITFRVARVGRSDRSVNNQLHVYVGAYRAFGYVSCWTAEQAFEAECDLYHDFEPLDSPVHPLRQKGTAWRCPRCNLFG